MDSTIAEKILTMKKFVECYKQNCVKDIKFRDMIRTKYNDNYRRILALKRDNKIDDKKYKELISKNNDEYYFNTKHINLYKCQLNKCYDETSKYLDNVNKNTINISKKKEKYDIDEYINLIKKVLKFYEDKDIYVLFV